MKICWTESKTNENGHFRVMRLLEASPGLPQIDLVQRVLIRAEKASPIRLFQARKRVAGEALREGIERLQREEMESSSLPREGGQNTPGEVGTGCAF